MKKKVLFLIHDLCGGGAEKVLVNLVNNMNRECFDVSVIALFGGGIHENDLADHIHYHSVWRKVFRGNSTLMKLLSPVQLHNLCIKDKYDIEIAYLEGPSARIISGCVNPRTRLFCWIHSTIKNKKSASGSFRNYKEAEDCYRRYEKIVTVSEDVGRAFKRVFPLTTNITVNYNTLETDKILELKNEPVKDCKFRGDELNVIAVGKITKNKGFDRLAIILKKLRMEKIPVHIYILGTGPDQKKIEEYLIANKLESYFTFLGYKTNPYKYMEKCDLFVCSSLSEGFSTAATEALIVGIPVCSVNVSGMKEMLGANNEWGVVTENDNEALYNGIRRMLSNNDLLKHYRNKAVERGNAFLKENTVRAVERMLEEQQYDNIE